MAFAIKSYPSSCLTVIWIVSWLAENNDRKNLAMPVPAGVEQLLAATEHCVAEAITMSVPAGG